MRLIEILLALSFEEFGVSMSRRDLELAVLLDEAREGGVVAAVPHVPGLFHGICTTRRGRGRIVISVSLTT